MEEVIGFVVRLKDSASTAATRIAKSISGIGAAIRDMTRNAWRGQTRMDKFFTRIARKARATAAAFSSVSLALNDASMQLVRITSLTVGVVASMTMAGIEAASQVEASNARLDFALMKIGRTSENTKGLIDDVSLSTVLTRREVTNMVTGLALQRIDAFDDSLGQLFVTMQDGSQVGVSSLEVMNDAVAFSGKNAQRIMRGVREAVSERKIRTGRWLSEDLEIGGKELDKWNQALKQATGPQEAFNSLMLLMAERVGGISKAVEHTLDFVLKQVADWRDKLSDELFRGALPVISQFIRDVGKEFIALTKEDYFAPIREAITDIVEGAVFMAKGIFIATKALIAFVRQFPWVLKLAVVLGGLLTLLTGVGIAIAGIMAPILAFGGLAMLLPTILIALKAGIILFVKLSLIAAVVLAPILLIVGAFVALSAAYVQAEGVVDFFKRWGMIIKAVAEGISNLEGTTTRLSLETAAQLEKSGLMTQVLDLLQIYVKLRNAAVVFKDTLVAMWPKMVDAMEPAINSFLQLSEHMGLALGMERDNNLKGWEKWGQMLARIIGGVGVIFVKMVSTVLTMMNVLARKMLAFGVMSTDEYARMMNAPAEFFQLDPAERRELVDEGTFTDRGLITGGFNAGADDRVITNPDELDPAHRRLIGPALAWAQGLKQGRDSSTQSILDNLKGLGSSSEPIATYPVATPATYADLGVAQRFAVDEALFDNKISDTEFEKLSRMIGIEFAKQLRANPLALKIDKEALAEGVEEGANASWEKAS